MIAMRSRRSRRTRTRRPPPGCNVTAEKLKITVLSAMMTALAGALYCQYQMFISPDTVSGISVSLQMVFAVGGRRHLRVARARRSAR